MEANSDEAFSEAISLSHLSHQKLKNPDLSAHVDQTPIDLIHEDHRKEALPPSVVGFFCIPGQGV